MFKLKFSKKEEYGPFKFSQEPTRRIGMPSDLEQGDIINIFTKSFYITKVFRHGNVENVEAMEVGNTKDRNSLPVFLPSGEPYFKLSVNQ